MHDLETFEIFAKGSVKNTTLKNGTFGGRDPSLTR